MSKLDGTVKDLILYKIIGNMNWHGETYADEKSLENMEAAFELVSALIDSIYNNADLASNAVATSSGLELNKRAKNMMAEIKCIASEVV